jgi:hypothetical protein
MVNLELIMKLPKDKLPFIGILFQDSYTASSTNKSFANNYRTDLYTIEIIPKNDVLADIKMHCECSKGQYLDVKCNMQALKRFVQITHYHPYIHWGHIYSQGGKHKIAKTTNQDNWVLKLAKISVIETNSV